MMLEIQVLVWDRPNNMVGLANLMGSQPSSYYLEYTFEAFVKIMFPIYFGTLAF